MIKSIHDLGLSFNQIFNPIWIESYDWSDEEHSIESYQKASEVISQFKETVFVCFSKSLLKGEYIVNPKILEDLEQFHSFLFDEQKIDEEYDNPLKDRLTKNYQVLRNEVSFLNDTYRHFIVNLSNKYRPENHHYLVNAFSVLGRDESVSPLLNVFISNELFVFHLEHNFSRSDSTIRQLIFTKEHLEKIRNKYSDEIHDIIDLFIDRSHYLLVKLLYNEKEIEYLLDFKRQVLPERTKDESVNSLLDLFKFYYKDIYAQNESIMQPIQNKILKEQHLRFQEFVLLFKYYKDSGLGTITQFNNAINDFESKCKATYPLFGARNYDVYALNTLKNYAYNCRLSFLIDHNKDGLSFTDLKKEMDTLIQLQSETGIFNFYPYRRAVKKLINDVKNYLHSDDYDENLFDEMFDTLKDYYSKFCAAEKWCKESSFFPILNLYQECSFKNEKLGIKVYYPSSYSRYVDYDLLRNERMDFDREIRIIESERSIKRDFQSLDKLKEDIEKSKRSIYELFGIFTSLVAIVFGGISLFSEKESPAINPVSLTEAKQLLNYSLSFKAINFLSFSSCILILISLVYFISLPREKSFPAYFRHPKTWVFLVLIILSFVAIISLLRILV